MMLLHNLNHLCNLQIELAGQDAYGPLWHECGHSVGNFKPAAQEMSWGGIGYA